MQALRIVRSRPQLRSFSKGSQSSPASLLELKSQLEYLASLSKRKSSLLTSDVIRDAMFERVVKGAAQLNAPSALSVAHVMKQYTKVSKPSTWAWNMLLDEYLREIDHRKFWKTMKDMPEKDTQTMFLAMSMGRKLMELKQINPSAAELEALRNDMFSGVKIDRRIVATLIECYFYEKNIDAVARLLGEAQTFGHPIEVHDVCADYFMNLILLEKNAPSKLAELAKKHKWRPSFLERMKNRLRVEQDIKRKGKGQ